MRTSIILPIAALLVMAQGAAAQEAEAPGHIVLFASPVKAGEIFVHDLLWICAGRACAAVLSNSRPVVVCMAMARTFGPIAAFDTQGAQLRSADLARCNTPRGERRLTALP